MRNNFDVFPFPDCPKSEKNVDGKDFTQEPATECIPFFTLSCKCWPSDKEIITFWRGAGGELGFCCLFFDLLSQHQRSKVLSQEQWDRHQ